MRIDYRRQGSSEGCIEGVGEVLVQEGNTVYDLYGWTCEHAAAEHQTVVEKMVDTKVDPIIKTARGPN